MSALCHLQLVFKGLGAIPGPIVFGALLDRACLFKQASCHAADSSCVVMDNTQAAQVAQGMVNVL